MKDFFKIDISSFKSFFTKIFSGVGGGTTNVNYKKVLRYLFYGFISLAIIVYIYSILFNVQQIKKQRETTLEIQDLAKDVDLKKVDYKQNLNIVSEAGSIGKRDYLYNLYLFLENEINKSQQVPVRFGNVNIDEKTQKIDFELKYVKYLSIEKILKELTYGKTFLKIRTFTAKYEYLQDYDMSFYTLKISGDLIQYKGIAEKGTGSLSSTGILKK